MNDVLEKLDNIEEKEKSLSIEKSVLIDILHNQICTALNKSGYRLDQWQEDENCNDSNCVFVTALTVEEEVDLRENHSIFWVEQIQEHFTDKYNWCMSVDLRYGIKSYWVLKELINSDFYKKVLLHDNLSESLPKKNISDKRIKI